MAVHTTPIENHEAEDYRGSNRKRLTSEPDVSYYGNSTAANPTRQVFAWLGIADVHRVYPTHQHADTLSVTSGLCSSNSSTMARMHTRRRGSSDSDKPVADEPPEWSDVDEDDIEERIVELADQGHSPSQIGLKLRDEGVKGTPIPNVKLATGKKLTEILEDNDATGDFPEDLRNLMVRAVRLREHMDENPQDAQNKRALQNTQSKVRRLVDYYRGDELDEDFTYSYDKATELLD